jgi:hypothetical protein
MVAMNCFWKKLLTVLFVCITFLQYVGASDNYAIVQTIRNLTSDVMLPSLVSQKINTQDPSRLTEEELINIISITLSVSYPAEKRLDVIALQQAKDALIQSLRSYTVTGFSFAIDPDLAFIVETQNPDIKVIYRDFNGNAKHRLYRARIHTVGFKLEASIKIDLIFIVNTDFNFYDTNKTINLGTGIDMNVACFFMGIGLTYVPFENVPGALFIISYPMFFAFPSLSLVTGGTLTPA